MRKKVIYIISDIDKALTFEWIARYFQEEFNIQFILIGPEVSVLGQFLNLHAVPCHAISDKEYPSRFAQWLAIVRIIRKEKPEIVHTHLWRANLLGLTASWLLGVPERIYTRHHATIHHREYPTGLKWDKLCNRLATKVIAISENIKQILVERENVNPVKVMLINHGFDFHYFEHVSEESVTILRAKLNLSQNDHPVVGVISRYTHWKGVQYIIPAFETLLKEYPNAVLVLANAKGDFEDQIKSLLAKLPLSSYREILFEQDLAALYQLFDVFVHVPTDAHAEAFGQTYVEALIAGVPSIFTLSGVAREFIKDKYNAVVVDFKNSDQIADGLLTVLKDKVFLRLLKDNGRQSVEPFRLEYFIEKLKKLYRG